MFKETRALSIVVETPLHAGSGSELGIVDLPIQRERHTQHPKIEGSSLKGCLREAFEGQQKHAQFADLLENYTLSYIDPVFGPEKGDDHAGAIGLTDARLLLFPVKSMKGVFAWITCPAVLNRLQQDLALTQQALPALDLDELKNSVPEGTSLYLKENSSTVVLEEYSFEPAAKSACTDLAKWLAARLLPPGREMDYWRSKMTRDLVVLNDDDFCDFVMMSTEVIARTKINNETGTVQSGALWYEEYLPADSLLYSLALTSDPFDLKEAEERKLKDAQEIMDFFTAGLGRAQHIFQLGGNATIGKGLIRVHVMDFTEEEG